MATGKRALNDNNNMHLSKILVSEMTRYVSTGTLNPTHSLTYSFYELWNYINV